jgi:P27 family predicted phage terminase small subunit
MGSRGPAPQPTALKVIRGNPGKRALNHREPQPRDAAPHCPDYLDEVARKEWRRLLKILRFMRVLTEADYMALASLCQAFSTMSKAQKQLTQTGILFKTPSGYVQQSPLFSMVNQSAELVTKLCREFGLTPSARSRVTTIGQNQSDNPFDEFRNSS